MGNELENSSNKKYLLIFFGFIGVLGIILIIVFATKKNTSSSSPPANTTIPSCLSNQSCSDSTVCTCSDGTSCDSSTNSCKTTTVPSCSGATYNCNDKSCACSAGTSCGNDGKCSSTNIPGCTGTYNCNDKSCACSAGTSCTTGGQCSITNIPGCTGTYNCSDNSCACPLGSGCTGTQCVQYPIVIAQNSKYYSPIRYYTITDPIRLTTGKGSGDGGQDVMGCWTLNDLNPDILKYGQSCAVGSIQLPPNIKATGYKTYHGWEDICSSGTNLGQYPAGSLINFPTDDDKIPCAFKFEQEQ